jgi:hypothetical protein
MPTSPRPAAQAHLWFFERLHAERVQVDGPPA